MLWHMVASPQSRAIEAETPLRTRMVWQTKASLCAGVVLPVYTFGSEAELPDDQTPLRWYTQCHREPAPVYRTLANSHWLSHSSKGALHYRCAVTVTATWTCSAPSLSRSSLCALITLCISSNPHTTQPGKPGQVDNCPRWWAVLLPVVAQCKDCPQPVSTAW